MTWKEVLTLWDWRWDIVLVLLALGAMYTRGWWHMRRRGSRKSAGLWRLVSYWGGLFLLLLALVSPIAVLSEWLFSVHMVQHLFLIMFGPPLLWLANPMPAMLWAFPARWRLALARTLFGPHSPWRHLLRRITHRRIAWLAFVTVYLGWHDPNLYNWALRLSWSHDLEHLSFFLVAMVYWWHITNAGPRIHGRFSFPSRLVYLLSAVPLNMVAGLAIAFANQPIYTYYTTVPRYFGLSVLDDQRLGGMIMWIFGSMMLIYAALVFIARYISQEERKTARHPYHLAEDAHMRAPGWEERPSP